MPNSRDPKVEERGNTSLDNTKINSLSLSFLGIAQICSWGTLYYSFPQIAVAMGVEMGWAKPDIYLAVTIGFVFSALTAVPIGIAIDKGYGRLVMTGGSVLAGTLLIAWSQVSSLAWFYVIFAGIGILQAATLYNATFAVIAKHFETEQMRHSITTLTLWAGFASTVFIPLIELLAHSFNWREILIFLAIVNIGVCAVIYYLTIPESGALPTAKTTEPHSSLSIKWVYFQPVFWALLVTFILFAGITSGFRFHLYPMLLEKGLSGKDAVFIIALLGPAQVAGRIILKLMDSKSIVYIGIFVISLFPLSLAAFTYLPAYWLILIPTAIAFGAASGIMTIIKAVAIPEFLTKKSYGTIDGMMNLPITLMLAIAPSIAAISWNTHQNYDTALISLTFVGFAMWVSFALAAFFSKRRNH